MTSDPHRAIIVIGAEEPTEALLSEAERYEEVFVVARRVPDPGDRWVVDDDRAEAAARGRLARAVARLRGRGVRAVGADTVVRGGRTCGSILLEQMTIAGA